MTSGAQPTEVLINSYARWAIEPPRSRSSGRAQRQSKRSQASTAARVRPLLHDPHARQSAQSRASLRMFFGDEIVLDVPLGVPSPIR
jgi:hypothetical protein